MESKWKFNVNEITQNVNVGLLSPEKKKALLSSSEKRMNGKPLTRNYKCRGINTSLLFAFDRIPRFATGKQHDLWVQFNLKLK